MIGLAGSEVSSTAGLLSLSTWRFGEVLVLCVLFSPLKSHV